MTDFPATDNLTRYNSRPWAAIFADVSEFCKGFENRFSDFGNFLADQLNQASGSDYFFDRAHVHSVDTTNGISYFVLFINHASVSVLFALDALPAKPTFELSDFLAAYAALTQADKFLSVCQNNGLSQPEQIDYLTRYKVPYELIEKKGVLDTVEITECYWLVFNDDSFLKLSGPVPKEFDPERLASGTLTQTLAGQFAAEVKGLTNDQIAEHLAGKPAEYCDTYDTDHSGYSFDPVTFYFGDGSLLNIHDWEEETPSFSIGFGQNPNASTSLSR